MMKKLFLTEIKIFLLYQNDSRPLSINDSQFEG